MKPKQLPSGAWRLQVYVGKDQNGKRKFVSVTRLDKNDCIIEAAKIAKHHHEVTRDPSKMTLGEAIEKYLSIKSNVLSPSTIRGYDSIRLNHLQPEMDMQLRNITNVVAQSAVNREASYCSPKTVRNVYGLLAVVIRQFEGRDLSVKLPQKIPHEVELLSEEELKQLFKAIDGDKAEVPILLATILGLRRSEIIALTHKDFDSKRNILNVSKAKVQNKDQQFVVKTTKTVKSNRKLSVPPYLASKLNECIAKDIPFCTLSPHRICSRLEKICEENDIHKIRLHDLRHQNASIMLALGIADKYAMERGGWSSNATMKNIYQHTISSEKVTVDNQINNYFESLVDSNS